MKTRRMAEREGAFMGFSFWREMKRRNKVIAGSASFGIVSSVVLYLATGSAHVGLHGSFVLTICFTLWLESRLER